MTGGINSKAATQRKDPFASQFHPVDLWRLGVDIRISGHKILAATD
jgi:hypothetical protein